MSKDLELFSYGSSSAGNCYWFKYGQKSFFIDLGKDPFLLEWDIQRRIDMLKTNLVLISHEHTDHTKNLLKVVNKTKAKLYMHPKSFKDWSNKNKVDKLPGQFVPVIPGTTYYDEDLNITIHPILVNHNSIANNGYFIDFKDEQKTGLFITDCGSLDFNLLDKFLIFRLSFVMIECNHIHNDLNSKLSIKEEIQYSNVGHFSNIQVLELIEFITLWKGDSDLDFIFIHTSDGHREELLKFDDNLRKTKNLRVKRLNKQIDYFNLWQKNN
ncbi:MBL fold metallo-hydrolase [Mycoplasmopsis felis]|uniref:MBL fold metallo-hydrolase n=1 Tax=Mycoplasmopsis felis TaxID=33923 RepID=UPI002AFFF337|nr:MBL fold metallo-hydrolase [Mycoplasmopsis felis]WQQ06667.1 MBL fold metallo-hydrolase [Mycoplasmopsis felis]